MRRSVLYALLAVATTSMLACDAALLARTNGQGAPGEGGSPVMAANAQANAQIKPDELDLESINYLVKKGKVKDAEALEKAINNPKEKLHSIDIDGDGKLDKIQIIEIKKPNNEIVFELHVIPSGKGKDEAPDVIVAYIDFAPDQASGQLIVKATYAPIVIGYDTIVYDYTVPIVVQGETIVVVDGPVFYGWLFAVRPAYVGVVVVDVAPVVIHKHKHKGKHKWKGKGKGKWHWH